MNRPTLFLLILSTLFAMQAARADIVITARETGGDVIFSYTGSLSVSGYAGTYPNYTQTIRGTVSPGSSLIYFGPVDFSDSQLIHLYSGVVATAPTSVGTGGPTRCIGSTGSHFSINPFGVGVPVGYVDGQTITGTTTYASATLQSLGFATAGGPYVWTLANGQRVTLQIGSGSSIPPDRAAKLRQKLKDLRFQLRQAKRKGQRATARRLQTRIALVRRQIRDL